MDPIQFKAPWSRKLKASSIVSTALLGGMSAVCIALYATHRLPPIAAVVLIALPIVIILAALPSMVLGYTLTQDVIQIKRLTGITTLPLATLQSVEGNADVMDQSVPVFGNKGMFVYSGWWWNKQLKFHRVYATDKSRAVVLRFTNRTLIITPHDPQQFIMRARTLLKTSAHRV